MRSGWDAAKAAILSGEHFLVVLDEVTFPLTHGWLPLEDVLHTLQNRPNDVHVVLTGRHCPPELIALADTVTEMTNRKGPGSLGSLPRSVVPDNPAERNLTGGGGLDIV